MIFSFSIPGQPQGKAHARTVRRGGKPITYTPDRTVEYEELVRTAWRKKYGDRRVAHDGAALEVIVQAFYKTPKTNKATKELMIRGEKRPTVKPDWDNIGKIVCDALNPVIDKQTKQIIFPGAWRDDAQVARALVEKWYSLHPRVDVYISEIQPKKGDES